jgi:hypothetical protein
MTRHSTLPTRTRRLANQSAKRVSRSAKAAALKSPKAVTGVALDPIAQAIDRWLTLCVTGKRIPQRVWDQLDHACGEWQAQQVRGTGPKAELVRAWLGYRAAQAAVQRGTLLRTDASFHAAYVAWQQWKEHGRHARR